MIVFQFDLPFSFIVLENYIYILPHKYNVFNDIMCFNDSDDNLKPLYKILSSINKDYSHETLKKNYNNKILRIITSCFILICSLFIFSCKSSCKDDEDLSLSFKAASNLATSSLFSLNSFSKDAT